MNTYDKNFDKVADPKMSLTLEARLTRRISTKQMDPRSHYHKLLKQQQKQEFLQGKRSTRPHCHKL